MEFTNAALDATGRPGTSAEILPGVWQSFNDGDLT